MAVGQGHAQFSDGTGLLAFTDAVFTRMVLLKDNQPNSPGCETFDHSFEVVAIRQAGGGKPLFGILAFGEGDITNLSIGSDSQVRPLGSSTNLPAAIGYELISQAGSCNNLAIFNIDAV